MAFLAIAANIARSKLKKKAEKKAKKKKGLVGSALDLQRKGQQFKSNLRRGVTDKLGISSFDLNNPGQATDKQKKRRNIFGNL